VPSTVEQRSVRSREGGEREADESSDAYGAAGEERVRDSIDRLGDHRKLQLGDNRACPGIAAVSAPAVESGTQRQGSTSGR
jgi:hypothetical protein